uniref:Uncharacterized protein n=1 Tax=Eutreptiella gymnastica TaxID=73025 RepID=A0A7S1J9D9_9EUGL
MSPKVMALVAAVSVGAFLLGMAVGSVPASEVSLYAPSAVSTRPVSVLATDRRMPMRRSPAQSASSDTVPMYADGANSYPGTDLASVRTPVAPSSTVSFALAGVAVALGAVASFFYRRQEVAMMAVTGQISKVTPIRDLILMKLQMPEQKTTGGLVLPDSSKQKPTSGDVISVGKDVKGVKPGDCILYSAFGVQMTPVKINGEEHLLMAERDIMGVMPRTPAAAKDIPEMRPLADAILLKRIVKARQTSSGLVLTQSSDAEDKYSEAVVVAIGEDPDITIQVGQKVIFSRYAGESLYTPDGGEYVCLTQSDLFGVM